jgi:uncharacterized protein (DUF2236 family)
MAVHEPGPTVPVPSNRAELIKYLEAVLPRTEAEDSTAGFLLRIVLEALKALDRPGRKIGF